MSRHNLDVCGQLCPIPVIRTQGRIAELQPGDILEVHCTDPGALQDIPAWVRIHGHRVIETIESDDVIRISIEVSG